jgi:hypothetical protein
MATRKAATKARTVQKAKAKPLGPPVKATAANTVVVMDLGYGDVFELVEQVELETYAINRSVNAKQRKDGDFDVSEWRCLSTGIERLSDALRAVADEIDRVDQERADATTKAAA